MLSGINTASYFRRKEDERICAMLERHRERVSRKVRRIARDKRALREEIDNTESDLGRTLLLAMTINRLLVRKQALSSGEIAQVARKWMFGMGSRTGNSTRRYFGPRKRSRRRARRNRRSFCGGSKTSVEKRR